MKAKPRETRFDGEDWTVYENVEVPQTEPFKDKRLVCAGAGQDYKIATHGSGAAADATKQVTANGIYILVVLAERRDCAYVRRHVQCGTKPARQTSGMIRGHSAIAQGEPVVFAGEVRFTAGKIIWWNRVTGHYRVGEQFPPLKVGTHIEAQTRVLKMGDDSCLLPMDKFQTLTFDEGQ